MILQRSSERPQSDPAPEAVLSDYYGTFGPVYPPIYANLPSYVDRISVTAPSGALTPAQAKAYQDPITFSTEVSAELLQMVAGRASWFFLAKYTGDPAYPPSVVFVAQTVEGLLHIQSMIEALPKSTWYIECGHGFQSSLQRILAPDITTLINDFHAIYGDVNEPHWYEPPTGFARGISLP